MRTVADDERVLGQDHPETLSARCGLARYYHQSGSLREAIEQYEKALPGLQRGLGPTDPTTTTAHADLTQARHQATTT